MAAIDVVGIGALNIDQIYRVERVLLDGEAPVDEPSTVPGGSAANTIYGLAKLGMRTGFIGAVGDDETGGILIEDFKGVGVEVSQIKFKERAKTGSVLCLSDKQGKRSLYVMPGANNLLNIEDIELDYVNQTKIIHLASFVHERQFELQKQLAAELDLSVKVSFAPGSMYASKGIRQLAPLLRRTHILFINHDELSQLTGEDYIPGAQKCLEQGCRIVVVTLGGKRERLDDIEWMHQKATTVCYILHHEGEYLVESKPNQDETDVETTGAGDAFAAGFLYGFLKGKDLEQCGLLGDMMARFSITKIGAREGLPSLAELSQRYPTI
jgi:ribokinase